MDSETRSTAEKKQRMSSDRMCEGRVCIVTGAGRGLGREYALLLAGDGAKVVVNDLGAPATARAPTPVRRRRSSTRSTAPGARPWPTPTTSAPGAAPRGSSQQAIDTFGRLDVLVNNAGILRDRMMFTMTEDEWDAVIRVHLKGTFAPSHHAAVYWRERSKAGETNDARIINTTSVSGIYGNAGQTNYGAAKAGIAAFTRIAAQELGRYGVTVNAIAPGALTRMTEDLGMPDEFPERGARVGVAGGHVAGVAGLRRHHRSGHRGLRPHARSGGGLAPGPSTEPVESPEEVGPLVRKLLADARPRTLFHEVS